MIIRWIPFFPSRNTILGDGHEFLDFKKDLSLMEITVVEDYEIKSFFSLYLNDICSIYATGLQW